MCAIFCVFTWQCQQWNGQQNSLLSERGISGAIHRTVGRKLI
jgi:hypothetical protein